MSVSRQASRSSASSSTAATSLLSTFARTRGVSATLIASPKYRASSKPFRWFSMKKE